MSTEGCVQNWTEIEMSRRQCGMHLLILAKNDDNFILDQLKNLMERNDRKITNVYTCYSTLKINIGKSHSKIWNFHSF